MADNRLGLNLVTLRGGLDADDLASNLDRIKNAGFQGLGIWVETVEQWVSSGRSVSQMAEQIRNRGLRVEELCFVSVLTENGTVADARKVFEWARELGSAAVIAIYGTPDRPLERAREDWGEFVRKVEDIGVSPAFEFIGALPRYNNPLEAWEVLKAGPELGSIVFDTFHFWRGGCQLPQIAAVPAQRVSLVHLNDVRDVPRETASDADRTYPGEGIMPLQDILAALLESGFTGACDVEIFGEVQENDPEEVARHAYQAANSLIRPL